MLTVMLQVYLHMIVHRVDKSGLQYTIFILFFYFLFIYFFKPFVLLSVSTKEVLEETLILCTCNSEGSVK